jgi:hypothetical protein
MYCRDIKGNEISSNGRVSRLSHGLASLTVDTTHNTWRAIGTSCTHRVLVLMPSSEFEFYEVKFRMNTVYNSVIKEKPNNSSTIKLSVYIS